MKKNLKLAISLVSFLAVDLSFAPKVSDAQSLPAACVSANVTDPQTGKPVGFLTGPEFLNNGAMTLQDIRDYLRRDDIKSWYAGDAEGMVLDTDGQKFDFAKAVFEAAANPNKDPNVAIAPRPINPQLILTMIRKESRTLPLPKRPDNQLLACVAGCGCVKGAIHTIRSQITCAARTLRNRFDELAACADTPNRPVWNLNKPSSDDANKTQDGINVTPSNAATVAHFPYNPVAGVEWGGGGRAQVGGVALFCILWHRDMDKRPGKNGFGNPPRSLTLSSTNPTLTCSDPLTPISPRTVDYRNVTFSVSGGTPPYRWTATWPTETPGVIQGCGLNGEDAVLKPPTNNPNVGGTAYTLRSFTYSAFPVTISQWRDSYGCNDNYISSVAASTCTCGGVCPNTFFDPTPPSFTDSLLLCGSGNATTCNGHNISGLPLCTGNRQVDGKAGQPFDQRNQTMISQNCNPCVGVMRGATITVTDSANVSVSTTPKVQY